MRKPASGIEFDNGATPDQGLGADSPPRRPAASLARAMLGLPAAVLPLLPSATCPLCVAGYAGVLSALGLGFLVTEQTLRPLIAIFIGVSVLSVAWSSYRLRRWSPAAMALAGAAGVITGRLVWDLPTVLYAGVTLLVVASLWTVVMKRSALRKSNDLEQESCYESASGGCGCSRSARARIVGAGPSRAGEAQI